MVPVITKKSVAKTNMYLRTCWKGRRRIGGFGPAGRPCYRPPQGRQEAPWLLLGVESRPEQPTASGPKAALARAGAPQTCGTFDVRRRCVLGVLVREVSRSSPSSSVRGCKGM